MDENWLLGIFPKVIELLTQPHSQPGFSDQNQLSFNAIIEIEREHLFLYFCNKSTRKNRKIRSCDAGEDGSPWCLVEKAWRLGFKCPISMWKASNSCILFNPLQFVSAVLFCRQSNLIYFMFTYCAFKNDIFAFVFLCMNLLACICTQFMYLMSTEARTVC